MTVAHADVVVVGGGSTGCVVAARLSEDRSRTVTLIESGPGFSGPLDIPSAIADARILPVGPGSPWTMSYPAFLAAGVERSISRGRLLGGSGAVNGGYFVRARPEDFDAWPSNWSYESVLPYFRMSETDHDVVDEWHGSSGPIDVARVRAGDRSEVTSAFVDAAVESGYADVEDLNSPATADGVGSVPLNVIGGVRRNAASAYLLPDLARDNLRVQTESTVLSVLFEGVRAVGVEVLRDGKVGRITADTVVLCAGAVRTPQLLMLSGVGPADALVAKGISVVMDHSQVGQRFSDHPEVGVYYRNSFTVRESAALEAVLHTEELEIRPFTAAFDTLIPGLPIGDPMIGIGLMRPESRGSIELRSSDPLDPPLVHYRYLESMADRAKLRRGLDIVADLLRRPSLRKAIPLDVAGDPLEMHLGTSLHLSGSAAMGDSGAVLDDRCRVRGIDGLVVADTSAFPVVPSRGPHATAIMLAERVSALSKGAVA